MNQPWPRLSSVGVKGILADVVLRGPLIIQNIARPRRKECESIRKEKRSGMKFSINRAA